MSKLNLEKVYNALKVILNERVSKDENIREEHGKGFSYHTCLPPDIVVYPNSEEEVAKIVQICSKHKIPMIPFGAGTSVEGQVLALEGGVCIDLKGMDKVLEVNYVDMYLTVQAGVTRLQVDELLKGSGFFFPIGPSINATLGGMASTRASGTNAVRYGTMKENVLSLKVVLPNGQIVKTGSKARKMSAGYDLTRLFIGSEGTLGIITEITIKLYAYPDVIKTALCTFQTIEDAVNTTIKVVQNNIKIAKIELLDTVMMRAINRYLALDYLEKPTLMIEFHGSRFEVEEQISKIMDCTRNFNVEDWIWEKDEKSRARLWQVRAAAAISAQALLPGSKVMSTDVCVPISNLAKCILETQVDIEASGLIAPIVGHVGDGNFHLAILIHPNNPLDLEKAKALNNRLVIRALKMEGACSGEHGIGIGKLPYMYLQHGNAIDTMLTIKKAIDPYNLMNPGKLLPQKSISLLSWQVAR